MQVQTVGQGPHPDFSIAGSTVTVDGIAVDCDARQADAQIVIDISSHNGKAQEGGGGYLLASIRIPPRQYTEVESHAPDDSPEGEQGATREAQPLNAGRVAVTVWPAI